jgi:hypothetical protein
MNTNKTPSSQEENRAIRYALSRNPYRVFLAEVDNIGYTPSGGRSSNNELFSEIANFKPDLDDPRTVLGQYNIFTRSPNTYVPALSPSCHGLGIISVLDAHTSFRLDPKFHLFQLENRQIVPRHMRKFRLGDLLVRRQDEVDPAKYPDKEFLTLTLSQEGFLSPREAPYNNYWKSSD